MGLTVSPQTAECWLVCGLAERDAGMECGRKRGSMCQSKYVYASLYLVVDKGSFPRLE